MVSMLKFAVLIYVHLLATKKGVIVLKYFVCSRKGIIKPKTKKSGDVVARYNRSTKRIGCKARLILKYDIMKRTYHVLKFEAAQSLSS